MKKTSEKNKKAPKERRLSVERMKIRTLNDQQLANVVGGGDTYNITWGT